MQEYVAHLSHKTNPLFFFHDFWECTHVEKRNLFSFSQTWTRWHWVLKALWFWHSLFFLRDNAMSPNWWEVKEQVVFFFSTRYKLCCLRPNKKKTRKYLVHQILKRFSMFELCTTISEKIRPTVVKHSSFCCFFFLRGDDKKKFLTSVS